MELEKDTICAIATSMNSAGIGVIRVSGPDSIRICDSIFKSKNKLADKATHTISYGHIYDDNEVIDEVLVLLMRSPRSYTTEDVVEIDCHGGLLVLQKVLKLLVKNGARVAEPGEFTKRAFLNGRIDLSSAEAVMSLISSKNEFARKNSTRQLSGSLYNIIKENRDKILYEIAFIESAIDDPEHYDLDGYPDKLSNNIDDILISLNKLSNSFSSGHILSEDINTLIIGKPNVGKSSLLNALSGRDKAIVTDIAGTTRDILEEKIILNGLSLNIIDTAGIRDTNDKIEQIGVSRALDLVDQASLILYVIDSSEPLDENDFLIIDKIKDYKVIIIFNKSDLTPTISVEEIKSKIDRPVISMSAKNLEGLDLLETTIFDLFINGEIISNNEVFLTNERQLTCVNSAISFLDKVKDSIENNMPEDFFSIDLMAAYEQLGLIIGQTVDDDLFNKIFSEFCMGK